RARVFVSRIARNVAIIIGNYTSGGRSMLLERTQRTPVLWKMSQMQATHTLQEWHESAPYWAKHRVTIRTMFAPLTRALIEDAQIREGQSVLDVAGGPGEPSLTIAETVGPSGLVTCTDAIAEMVNAAEVEARTRGLTNMRFRQCTAESLPFADNSFDRVVSR